MPLPKEWGAVQTMKCKDCGWTGPLAETVTKYYPLIGAGDVEPEVVCPKCDNDNLIDLEVEW